MTEPPFRPGDFVWSAYPERENPARPGLRHIGYVTAVTGSLSVNAVFLAYTTSQLWHDPKPFGLTAFNRDEAAGMGQSRPFTLDLRRLAAVWATPEWFPDIGTPSCGVVGRAPQRLRVQIEATAKDLLRRHPDLIERLGPLWPGSRR